MSGRSKRFNERDSVHKSNLNRHNVWRTQGNIKYDPKHSHKKHSFSLS